MQQNPPGFTFTLLRCRLWSVFLICSSLQASQVRLILSSFLKQNLPAKSHGPIMGVSVSHRVTAELSFMSFFLLLTHSTCMDPSLLLPLIRSFNIIFVRRRKWSLVRITYSSLVNKIKYFCKRVCRLVVAVT